MRLRLGIVLALVAGAAAFLLVKGLGDATVFFKNADEAVADRDDLGTKRFRLQGTVVPDSVETAGDAVEFDVEFHCDVVHVRHEGDPPELFKPGIPVVLEGHFAAPPSDVYESDKIFVRHTSEYRVEEKDRLELAEAEACP
ncbi:MAG TPA: cytochrome c maturation protein CcmE [Acidimicrobiales bacterium]|nr:cytochrome c maturation protein CcmE [Acidimicrobiales bacterium]